MILASILPWLKSTNLWLAACILALLAVIFIGGPIQKNAAFVDGVETGKGAASVATVESAVKTAEAERQAEVEVGNLDDRSDIIALCKRSASCKERRTLK